MKDYLKKIFSIVSLFFCTISIACARDFWVGPYKFSIIDNQWQTGSNKNTSTSVKLLKLIEVKDSEIKRFLKDKNFYGTIKIPKNLSVKVNNVEHKYIIIQIDKNYENKMSRENISFEITDN